MTGNSPQQSVPHPFEETETVHEPEAFIAGLQVGMIVTGISPAAQLDKRLCAECQYKNSNYYYPDNHRQGC